MSKIIANASAQFGKQLDKYIRYYGLHRTDMASFLSTTVRNIDKIIAGEKGLVLKTIERIAGFFGIAYFEMGNPDFPMPAFDKLPENTKKIIFNRQNNTKHERDYDLQFTKHLKAIVESNFLELPHTAKEVFAKMPKEIAENERYEPRRVTDSFTNGNLEKFVIKVGKRGKESLFQLTRFALTKDKPA